jgi:hypothetical protein
VSNLRLLVSYGKDYVRGTGAEVEEEDEDEEEGTASQPHQLSPAPAVTAEMSPTRRTACRARIRPWRCE